MSPTMTTKDLLKLLGPAVALALAGGSAYLSLDRRVEARLTGDAVEHIIDLKVGPRLDDIVRRLEHIDRQLDRRLPRDAAAHPGEPDGLACYSDGLHRWCMPAVDNLAAAPDDMVK